MLGMDTQEYETKESRSKTLYYKSSSDESERTSKPDRVVWMTRLPSVDMATKYHNGGGDGGLHRQCLSGLFCC